MRTYRIRVTIIAMGKEAMQVTVFFLFLLGGGVGFLLARLLI